MYEAACGICQDESQSREGVGKRVKLKFGESYPEKNIYVGETSRSIFERSQEHLKVQRQAGATGGKRSYLGSQHGSEGNIQKSLHIQARIRLSLKNKLESYVSRRRGKGKQS